MAFLENKYTSWYNNIIKKALLENRIKSTGQYYENHHVIPKALRGGDSPDNLVLLTAREHFICHILLTKMTTGINNRKMIFAASAMRMASENTASRYMNSRLFENIKIKLAKVISENNTGNPGYWQGKTFSEDHKRNISKAKTGCKGWNKGKSLSGEHRKNLSIARKQHAGPNKGKNLSEAHRNEISKSCQGRVPANKGIPKTTQQIEKMSLAVKGKKWYTNGTISKMCLPDTQPPGFYPGRIINKGKNKLCLQT